MLNILFLFIALNSHAASSISPQITGTRIGSGYDLLSLPDEIQALKKELHELQEKNKILEARMDSLEKNRVP